MRVHKLHIAKVIFLVVLLSFISEFLPARNRGCFMVTVTFCGAAGAVLTAGLAWWLLPLYGWRTFVAACSVPSYVILVYRCFVRFESPRSLFIRGKKEEAIKVLQAIARHNSTFLPKGMYYWLLNVFGLNSFSFILSMTYCSAAYCPPNAYCPCEQ